MPYADPEVRKAYHRKYQNERKLSTKAYQNNPDRRRKQREKYLRKVFGISIAEYDVIYADQCGLCAICRQPEVEGYRRGGEPKWLSVDHDHVSGNIRALLCRNCNTGLGHFRDDPKLLASAMSYLEGGGAR